MRKLRMTELESRIAPSHTVTVGQLLSMLPAGATLPANMRQVGTLNPDQQLTFSDKTWAALMTQLGKFKR